MSLNPPFDPTALRPAVRGGESIGSRDITREPARIEVVLAYALLAVVLFLKMLSVYHYRFDVDEAQHLHVVWGWATGQVQYRDVFDNHSPLFHMLCAPFLRAFGERADILVCMRLAMVPLYLLCLWCVYKIGAALYSPRIGMWTAVLAAPAPLFFFESTEFRTDDLWTPLWLANLVVFVSGELTVRRAFLFGLLLGVDFGVSMKTSLLLTTLFAGVVVAFIFRRLCSREPIDWRKLSLCSAATLGGLVIVPAILLIFFAALHALPQLYYCVVANNIVPGFTRRNFLRNYGLALRIALPFFGAAAFFAFRAAPNLSLAVRRISIAMGTVFYITVLLSYWPDVTREDYLPFFPMLAVVVAPLFFFPEWSWPRWKYGVAASRALVVAVVVVEIFALWHHYPLRVDHTVKAIKYRADVLRLTKPGDFVMDPTGESIFRPRAYYYVLETFVKLRMRMGLMPDGIVDELMAKRPAVAYTTSGVAGSKTRAFIEENYLPIGNPDNPVCVLGKVLPESAGDPDHFVFEVVIPARYALLCGSVQASGTLDGMEYTGPRVVESGRHEFRRAKGAGKVELFWADAFEKGYLPYGARH